MTLTKTVRNRYSAASYLLFEKPLWIRRTAIALAVCMLPALAQVGWETLHGCPLGCNATGIAVPHAVTKTALSLPQPVAAPHTA